MKRLCLLLALLLGVTIVSIGCAPSAHDRYRQMTWRYSFETDGITIQDDADAYILQERPTHLSQWYFP
jgi:membrane protein YdbS with pleckstrin-like domain